MDFLLAQWATPSGFLKLREGDVARGLAVTPKVGRMRFEKAAEDILNDYRVNGKKSFKDVECRIRRHLEPFFGSRRMANVRAFIVARQAAKASNGEINRELTALKCMFNLVVQVGVDDRYHLFIPRKR